MSDIIEDKYFLILTTKQYKKIKKMNGGIEELKWAANTFDLYVRGYRKSERKVIVNEKGDLELL